MELLVLTPERRLVEEAVEEVILPGKLGEMGILPGHTHLISELEIGIVLFKESGGNKERSVYIDSGVVEINNDVIKILTSSGEKAEDIDVEEVKKEVESLEKELSTEEIMQDKQKFNMLEVALKKALAKLQAAKYR